LIVAKEKIIEVKKEKTYSRMQAERGLTSGIFKPEKFLNMEDPFSKKGHPNYHVRAKAFKLMGRPIPEGWKTEDEEKFFTSIHYNPTLTEDVKEAEAVLEAEAASEDAPT
jgi:hypothetical protein